METVFNHVLIDSMMMFVLTDHVLIDSIAWVTDLNLLALKTRHGWRQVGEKFLKNVFGKFLKTQHC